jgi:hypothetical protein
MARGDQLARQWMIFQQLMSSKYGKTVNDLAADLDCHPRTVYRDLDALQVGGFPIYNEKANGTNFWALWVAWDRATARYRLFIFNVPEKSVFRVYILFSASKKAL